MLSSGDRKTSTAANLTGLASKLLGFEKGGEYRLVPHTIVSDVCEGVSDCVDACPVACIQPGQGRNRKGTPFQWINADTCIDCGICLQICPISGAILPEERPDLQRRP